MLHTPFYDPGKSWEDNWKDGPFGAFADNKVYKNKGKPEYEFLDQKVFLPFGIASGPLFNSKFIKGALDKGFDIVIQKTVRSRNKPSNQWPNVVQLNIKGQLSLNKATKGVYAKKRFTQPLTITNSFGNPSHVPDIWQPDLKKSVGYIGKGQMLICATEGTPDGSGSERQFIEDWVTTARLVKETGCKILEANTSCPNEGSSSLLCFDIAKTQKVLEAIKNEVGNMPLVVKVAYFPNYEQLKKLVKAVGDIVDCISCINTIPTKVIDKKGNEVLPGRLIAGACGDGVRWAGLDMVANLKKIREDLQMNFTIIGMGGVMLPKHYKKYRDTGADVVMSATAAMWNPYFAQEIKEKYL
ncbi:MAG TPA: hypothetical protein VLB73_04265 [Patescibacteria group bacterium]|nr:hypothetical protein [Patescibacteria group bacterium]